MDEACKEDKNGKMKMTEQDKISKRALMIKNIKEAKRAKIANGMKGNKFRPISNK